MRLRSRRRGVTYIEVIVAMAFVGICTATLVDSVAFSTAMIGYSERRAVIQSSLQSMIDEIRSGALSALPTSGTSNSTFVVSGSRTVSVSVVSTPVSGKNVAQIVVTATWPEARGTRSFTDSMSFELYVRGPDA